MVTAGNHTVQKELRGGGAIAPLTYFGRYLIPISISGADYAHQITTCPSPGFSNIPTALQL